ILWAILLLVMLGNLWERRRRSFMLGALALASIACPLLAGRFEPEIATASAWRWFAAILLLTASIAFSIRDRLARALAIRNTSADKRLWIDDMRAVLLLLTLTPLLFLTIVPVISEISYRPPHGPQSGFFHWIGNVALYSLPLIFAGAALAIHAVRERLPAFAFVAGLFVNLTVTVVHLLTVVAANGLMNRVVLAHTIQ